MFYVQREVDDDEEIAKRSKSKKWQVGVERSDQCELGRVRERTHFTEMRSASSAGAPR